MTQENKEKTKTSYLDICYKSFVIAGISVFMVTKSFEYYEKDMKILFKRKILLNIDSNLSELTRDQIRANALNYAGTIKDREFSKHVIDDAIMRRNNVESVIRKKTKELFEELLKEEKMKHEKEQMKNEKDPH